MKVSDYIARFLSGQGVTHIFLVTGGGAMHLNDSFGHDQKITCMYQHHEQACAMAAEAYARITGKIGVVNVTTGPGGINALNGVFGAWTDSIPLLVISGQVKRETCVSTYPESRLRQLGDQESDIIAMVKGITKYAVMITDPQTIRYHLERAMYLAQSGRPGPCWLDIPLDVQASQIEEDSLRSFHPEEEIPHGKDDGLKQQCREIIRRISSSPRPVLLAGSGIRHAHALDLFDAVIRMLGIPVTTAWTHDIIASDDPLYCGRPGTIGDRAGNFTVQNAETLLIIGSRLNVRQVSYNWKSFARHAYKIQVDVDETELNKPTVKPDMPVHCDAKVFLEELKRQLEEAHYNADLHKDWVAWCRERVRRYPVVLPRHRTFNGFINPYHFIETLFQHLAADDVVACGNATACIVPFQAAKIQKGQRLFSNSGSASMGYDLPAAIGAAVGREGKRVICLAGDGSLPMNIQELQTVAQNHLNIKIFVLNNGGYLSIRITQRNFFGRYAGEGPHSGVSFPDFVNVARAFGIQSFKIDSAEFEKDIHRVLQLEGPCLCEVILDPEQQFEPKLSSKQLPDGRIVSAPLEDLYPFLEREEFLSNLLIPPMEL